MRSKWLKHIAIEVVQEPSDLVWLENESCRMQGIGYLGTVMIE